MNHSSLVCSLSFPFWFLFFLTLVRIICSHDMIPNRTVSIIPIEFRMVNIVIDSAFRGPTSKSGMVFKRQDNQTNWEYAKHVEWYHKCDHWCSWEKNCRFKPMHRQSWKKMGWDEVRIIILRRPQILQNLHLTFVYSTYSKVKVKSSWTTKSFLACSQKVYRITDTYVSLLSLDFVRSHFRKMHTLVGFSIGKKTNDCTFD